MDVQMIMREGFIISSKMLKDHLCDSVPPPSPLSPFPAVILASQPVAVQSC